MVLDTYPERTKLFGPSKSEELFSGGGGQELRSSQKG
jgi:hypothetical protein